MGFPPFTAAYSLPIALVVSLGCVAAILLWVLLVFNDPRHNSCASTTLIMLGFVCALTFAALFPTDVALTLTEARQGIDDDEEEDDVALTADEMVPMLTTIYTVCYWVGLVMSCLLLPSLDMVIGSGAFGACARIADVAASIAKLVVVLVVLVAAITGIVMATGLVSSDDESFLATAEVTCIALTNSLGFVRITLLLSFGLVELPRSVWKNSFHSDLALNRHRLMVAREQHCVNDTKVQLQLALDDWYRYQDIVRRMRNKEKAAKLQDALTFMAKHDFELVFSDTDHSRAEGRARRNKEPSVLLENNLRKETDKRLSSEPLLLAELVAFRGLVGRWVREHAMAEGRLFNEQCGAFYLEDVRAAEARFKRQEQTQESLLQRGVDTENAPQAEASTAVPGNNSSGGGREGTASLSARRSIEWWDGRKGGASSYRWHVFILPYFSRATALFMAALTVCVMVAEVMTLAAAVEKAGSGDDDASNSTKTTDDGTDDGASTAAAFDVVNDDTSGDDDDDDDDSVDGFRLNTTHWHPLLMAACIYVVLAYAAVVLGWSTMKLEAGRENLLVRGRRTGSLSLSYYAQTAVGFTPPMLYYGLQFLFPSLRSDGENPHGSGADTAFFKAYGSRVQAFGGAGTFSLFFPLLMVILAVLQACGIYNRILRCTGLSWLSFDTDVVLDDDNHDDIKLGKRILRKKREAIGIDVKHKQMMAQQKRNKNRSTDKSTVDRLWQPKYGWNPSTLTGGGTLREPLFGRGRGGGGDDEDEGSFDAEDVWDAHAARISDEDRQHDMEQEDARAAAAYDEGDDDDDDDDDDEEGGPGGGGGGGGGSGAKSTPDWAKGWDEDQDDNASEASAAAPGAEAEAQATTVGRRSSLWGRVRDKIKKKNTNSPDGFGSMFKRRSVPETAPGLLPPGELGGDGRADEEAAGGGGGGSGGEDEEGGEDGDVAGAVDQLASLMGSGANDSSAATAASNSSSAGSSSWAIGSWTTTRPSSNANAGAAFDGTPEGWNVGISGGGGGGGGGGGDGGGGAVDNLVAAVAAHSVPAEVAIASGMDLSGWVEKFSRVKGWRLRWFAFNDETGQLEYYRFSGSAKDAEALTAKPDKASLSIDGIVDLRYVDDISSKPGEDRRVNIDAGPKRKFKLRFPSDPIGRHWKEQLEIWQDHHTQKSALPTR